jgi:ATP-binding cassette subfamily B (MDR/TAP) protein 1
MGWFDEKENTPGVLSATMASDAQTINGVSAEGLASSLEGMFAVLAGVVIGFAYNWKMSAVCIGCVPFMIVANIMNIKFQTGMSADTDAASKEATLLAGDSILNYRTVASFANEDLIVRDFAALLDEPVNIAIKKCHIIGCVFGWS